MENLFEIQDKLISHLENIYERDFYHQYDFNLRLTGIVGSRGVGKTTFLLNYIKENYPDSRKALYVSADNIYFAKNTLVDLVDKFDKEYAGELICIDEVHRYKNWSQEIKNIYDSYPNIRILFSGSSMVDLIREKYDLSRRAILRHLHGFSFREFLEFRFEKKFPKISLEEMINQRLKPNRKITELRGVIGLFKKYLQEGYYPSFKQFSDSLDFYNSLLGIIDKTIFNDIATYYSLKTPTLNVFKKILYFISTSTPSSINVNKLSKSLEKDNTDVANYLDMLMESGLLRYLLIDKLGHALIRNAEKVYINNTNLHYAINNFIGKQTEIGVIRELFVLTCLQNAGYKTFFSKKGDFKCQKYTLEIGGKNKTIKQIAGVKNSFLVKDNVLIGEPNSIPLYLFGFLY